jgi:hypothetical protein
VGLHAAPSSAAISSPSLSFVNLENALEQLLHFSWCYLLLLVYSAAMLQGPSPNNAATHETYSPLEPFHPKTLGTPTHQELLTQPLPYSVYKSLISRDEPPQVPSGLGLTEKRRSALNDSLSAAYATKDPAKRLMVLVRAYCLHQSIPEYAITIGLRPNSLLRLEQRGFIPGASVATSFSPLIQDWQNRAKVSPPSAPFFSWAQRELCKAVLRDEYTAPLGPILEWQLRTGSRHFQEKTGLAPHSLSSWRTQHKNISFRDLLEVASKLGFTGAASGLQKEWDATWAKRARRSFFHHSMKLDRSPSATATHIVLGWAGLPNAQPALRVAVPGVSHEDANRLARFQPISLKSWKAIRKHPTVQASVPCSALERLEQQVKAENSARETRAPSATMAIKKMRELRLSTKIFSKMIGAHDPSRPKWGTDLVRRVIFEGLASDTLPWGVVAATLASNRAEFSRLLEARAGELNAEYHRRTGRDLTPASLFRKIWSVPPAPDRTALEYGLSSCVADNAVRHMIVPLKSPSVQQAVHTLVTIRGLIHIWKKAGISPTRLDALATGSVTPSWPEYCAILQAAHIVPSSLHELAWRDQFGKNALPTTSHSELGNIQNRIIRTLVSQEARSNKEFVTAKKGHHTTEARYFRDLSAEGSLSSIHMRRLLKLAGVTDGTALLSPVNPILFEKSYPKAIARWIQSGAPGVDGSTHSRVVRLISSSRNFSSNNLWEVAASGERLLELRHFLLSASKHPDKIPEVFPTHDAVLRILRLFPGATVQDVVEAVEAQREHLSGLNTYTEIPQEKPLRIENYADRLLAERGIISAQQVNTEALPPQGQQAVAKFKQLFHRPLAPGENILEALFPERGTQPLIAPAILQRELPIFLGQILRHLSVSSPDAANIVAASQRLWLATPFPAETIHLVADVIRRDSAEAEATLSNRKVWQALRDMLDIVIR